MGVGGGVEGHQWGYRGARGHRGSIWYSPGLGVAWSWGGVMIWHCGGGLGGVSRVSGAGVIVVLTGGVTVLLARCNAALVGAGVVTWRMWRTAWCLGCISGVSGAGVAVVLTGGHRFFGVFQRDVDASVVAWLVWGPA